jgi:HNH endonuclease
MGAKIVSRAYIPAELRRQVRDDSGRRCGYCHSPETFLGMPLDIDHLVPEVMGGETTRENLWLACSRCNDFKGGSIDAPDPQTGDLTRLFNPRTQRGLEHFSWASTGERIIGLTPTGSATVEALHLNNEFIIVARRFWVEAGRWPPSDDSSEEVSTAPLLWWCCEQCIYCGGFSSSCLGTGGSLVIEMMTTPSVTTVSRTSATPHGV